MLKGSRFHQQIVAIAEDYLGPSGPRFIDRLAENHLGKPTARLTPADVNELVKWARLAAAMLTDDAALVAEFMARLEELSRSKRPAKRLTIPPSRQSLV
jgi:hypothetical protein